MPEDPEDSSIYNLLINSDPETIGTLTEQLNQLTAKGMSVAEALDQINASAEKATEGLAQIGGASTEGISEAATAVETLNEQLQNTQTQTERVNELLAQMRQNAAEAASAIPEPPPFPGLEEGGGGLGGGSYFAVGHAASVAGHALGAPALSGLGAGIYIEQGIQRVLPLFEQLNEKIMETPGLLTPLISGFTAMGIPMAGLLAVALPVTVAVAGVVIAFKMVADTIAAGEKALQGALDAQKQYYDAIHTGTTETIQQQIDKLKEQKATTTAVMNDINNTINQTWKTANGDLVKEAAAIKPLLDLHAQYDANKASADADQAAIDALTKAQGSAEVAANNLKESTEKLWKAQDEAALKGAEDTKSHILEGLKDKEMADKGEVDSVKNKSKDLKDQLAATDAAWLDLLKHGDKNSQEVQDQLKKYSDEHNKLAAEIEQLDGPILKAAQDAKNLADALKASDEAFKAASQAHDTYTKAVENSDNQLANQKANATTKLAQQEAELTQGSIQDSYQRSQIVLAESRKEVSITQDTANAIADVRTKLGQKEIADLTNYNRQLMDDQTKYQQDVQKDQTATYRKERDDYQSHVEKLASIQAKEANDQQDALLNRNFLALAKQQQGHQGEIDAENQAYARKQAANQQHLQDELADLAIHQAEVRTQQFVEYQRKLVDDRLHAQQDIDAKRLEEQRKIQTARQSETQQLADLTTTETYKIQILRQGFAQELKLYEQQAQQRVQIAARTEQQAAIQAWKASGGSQGAATALGLFSRDSGGPFGAGETFVKGNINEMFDFGSGGSYAIPGAAIVHPLQSGTATPTQGGHSITVPVQINANNKEQAARQASQAVYNRIMETFDAQ